MEFIHEKNRQEAQWVRRAIGRDSQSQISEGKGQNQGCAIKDADGGRAIHNGRIGVPAPMFKHNPTGKQKAAWPAISAGLKRPASTPKRDSGLGGLQSGISKSGNTQQPAHRCNATHRR